MQQLMGCWQIKATTFPMWLSVKRSKPTITYGQIANKPQCLSDLVTYQTNHGRTKKIKGVDHLKGEVFEWRGRGLLKPLTSRWQIVFLEEDLLVIRFSASLFTPAGVDLLVRDGAKFQGLEKLSAAPGAIGLTDEEARQLIWLLP
mgnify:CR=1 FL=1